jgi:FtsH-binding integral membrane protein
LSSFLYITGFLLWIASVILSIIFNPYGLIIFSVLFALGCISIGIGRTIVMYNELIDKQGEIKSDLNRVQVTLDEFKKQNK